MIIHIHKHLIDSVDHIKVLNELVSASKGRHARTFWNIFKKSLIYNGLLRDNTLPCSVCHAQYWWEGKILAQPYENVLPPAPVNT